MAGVIRILQIGAIRRSLQLPNCNYVRAISTSKKNRDTAGVCAPTEQKEITDFSDPAKQNWVSYGFDRKDKEEDSNSMHSAFFFSITVCFVFGGFVMAYYPDVSLRDWAQREAYLEIRRREELGLPHIDKNLVDPENIVLPSDEELGDAEIII